MLDPTISSLIGVSFAVLFASSALHKLRAPARFAETFLSYRVLPVVARLYLTWTIPLAEILVAVGLLVSIPPPDAGGTMPLRVPAALLGSALLLSYAAAIAINLGRGRRDLACGCGGPNERRPIGAWMVWRNLALAALLGTQLWPRGQRPLELTDAVTLAFGLAALSILYVCVELLLGDIPLRKVARRPGVAGGSE
jgi:hypothetical protein